MSAHAPLYWCPHWTTLNVTPCQSCIDEFGKQTVYYRESDYLALAADLRQLREAWNAHMNNCPGRRDLPSFEEMEAWRNAPANTMSADLKQEKPQ